MGDPQVKYADGQDHAPTAHCYKPQPTIEKSKSSTDHRKKGRGRRALQLDNRDSSERPPSRDAPHNHQKLLPSIKRSMEEASQRSVIMCASVKWDFVASVIEWFGVKGTLSLVGESVFVNIDETAVFFEIRTNQTVSQKADRTIVIRCFNSNTKRMTICVSCASDGSKLPLMFVLKNNPVGRIKKSIIDELSEGTFGSCGEKGWMDEHSCRVWLEKIWLPHVDGVDESLILPDDFNAICSKRFLKILLMHEHRWS
uniref:PREDICTED: leucinerich repeatcontaining protein 43like putative n=1 Tax=Albugo laibachii Nc14 TaxID=890382 RepID=F0W4X8_9STRA|nr:PREDICTED: leucinerich repeatcontaining protein 43like putative [Albugo laibachii Nc14]|eukprot:CCA16168.1 PREDICTED: leucinerich repeatcontaining protein 43like putative [Albugo laibachii Nc14]